MKIVSLSALLLIASAAAFAPIQQPKVVSRLASAVSDSSVSQHLVEKVDDEERVLDVASFRNSLTNPAMMVEKAKKKLAKVDKNKEVFNGAKTGLLYIGPVIALASYQATGDIMKAATDYAVLGGGLGAILAGNAYMGRSVYVPDMYVLTWTG